MMRVAIADDSALFRHGLALLLQTAGIEVTVQARSGAELVALLPSNPPDVAVLDIRMPPTYTDEGLITATLVRKNFPEIGVLVLSTYAETAYAVQLLSDNANAVGYLLKDRVDDVASLLDALHRIISGETVVDPEVVRRLLERRTKSGAIDQLANRERDVLELMAQGRSNAGIARHLNLSTKTVEKHIASLLTHLGINGGVNDNRRVLAVLTWLRGQASARSDSTPPFG